MGRVMNEVRRGVVEAALHLASSGPSSIASFTTDVSAPAKSVLAEINPVQDLHGYENPWPAGGGKNLFPITLTTQEKNGTTFTVSSDGSVKVSGTPSELTRVSLNSLSITPSEAMVFSMTGSATGIRVFCKKTDNGTVTYPTISPSANVAAGITLESFLLEVGTTFDGTAVTLQFQLEKGSTATDWTPYSNICPITGHTGLTAYRVGKNLFDKDNMDIVAGKYINSSGAEASLSNANYTATFIRVEPETAYTWTGNKEGGTPISGKVYYYDENKDFLSRSNDLGNAAVTVTTPANCCYIRLQFGGTSPYATNDFASWQFEKGSSATPFESYSGASYPVSWQDSAGTVYGGTLDVVSGLLTVTHTSITLDGQSSNKYFFGVYSGAQNGCAAYWNSSAFGITKQHDAICDRFVDSSLPYTSMPAGSFVGGSGVGTTWTFIVPLPSDSTLNQCNAWLRENPTQIVYRLPTPQTFQLTPTQVQMLLGVNNVWADSNGDTTVQYWLHG